MEAFLIVVIKNTNLRWEKRFTQHSEKHKARMKINEKISSEAKFTGLPHLLPVHKEVQFIPYEVRTTENVRYSIHRGSVPRPLWVLKNVDNSKYYK